MKEIRKRKKKEKRKQKGEGEGGGRKGRGKKKNKKKKRKKNKRKKREKKRRKKRKKKEIRKKMGERITAVIGALSLEAAHHDETYDVLQLVWSGPRRRPERFPSAQSASRPRESRAQILLSLVTAPLT